MIDILDELELRSLSHNWFDELGYDRISNHWLAFPAPGIETRGWRSKSLSAVEPRLVGSARGLSESTGGQIRTNVTLRRMDCPGFVAEP